MPASLRSAYTSLLTAQRNAERKAEEDKLKLLVKPEELDKMVAGLMQPFTPSPRATKKTKYASDVDALEASIPNDHPMKGVSRELRDKMIVALQDPRLQGVDPEIIASELGKRSLAMPTADGRSRLEGSYWYKRLADSAWFGIGGEDEGVKAPPGYEGWVGQQREVESKEAEAMPWMPTKEQIATGAGIGAAAGAALASPMGVTAGAGAVLGGASGAAYEVVQQPWSKLLATTEWGKARMHSGSTWDKVKVLGAEFGPTLIAGAKMDQALLRGFTVARKATVEGLTAIPVAENVLKMNKHQKEMKKFAKEINKRHLGVSPEVKGKYRKVEDFFKKTFAKKPDEVTERALVEYVGQHGTGAPDEVLHHLANQQRWRDIASGKISLAQAEREIAERSIPSGPAVLQLPEPKNFLLPESTGGRLLEPPAWMPKEPLPPKTAFNRLEEMLYGKKGGVHYTPKQIENMEFDAWAKRARWSETSEAPLAEGKDVSGRTAALKRSAEREAEDEAFRNWGIRSQRSYAQTFVDIKTDPVADKVNNVVAGKTRRGKLTTEPGTEVPKAPPKKAPDMTYPPWMKGPKRLNKGVRSIVNDVIDSADPEMEVGDMVDLLKSKGVYAYLDDDGFVRIKGISRNAKQAAIDKKIAEDVIQKSNRYEDNLANEISMSTLDWDGALKQGDDAVKAFQRGEITGKQAVDRIEASVQGAKNGVQSGVIANPNVVADLMDSADKAISFINSKAALTTFFALAGVGAAAFHMFSPDTAEASVGSLVARGAKAITGKMDEKMVGLMKQMQEKSLMVEKVTTDDVVHIAKEGFQVGLKDSDKGGPSQILKHGERWIKDATGKLKYKFFSPYQVGEVVLNVNENMLNNPAVWRASYSMAEYRNIWNGQRVFYNILKQAGIKGDRKALTEMFEPLVPGMKSQVEYDHALYMQKILEKAKKRITNGQVSGKKVKKSKYGDIEAIDGKLAEYKALSDKLAPEVNKFHQDYQRVARDAAAKSPSAKLFYALDDTPEFEKYPFLRDMRFTPTEEAALGQMREQLLVYKQRLKDLKVPTMDGPYAHYVLHPKYNAKEYELMAGDLTRNAYSKFYRRSLNSRPMVPDIEMSTAEYVYDIEKRIQNKTFWKQGWDKVERKYGDRYPVIGDIFRNLREGIAPHERSLTNKALRMYYNFEVLHHLFLNPSAGLKHLCKISGDIATRGPIEVARGISYGAKNVGWRVQDLNPTGKKALATLGFKTPQGQEKFLKNYMDSMIPTMHYRHRMLEMGLISRDEYFDSAVKMWNEAKKAGGKTMSLGSVWISTAELFDRGTSVMVGLRLAAKKGMTVEQAYYSNLDLILKNNFLGREQNPAWLRNPKFRALLIFQATPYKILERRLTTAIRTGRSIRSMGKTIFENTKTAEGRELLRRDMKNLWSYMKDAERETKANVFIDAILNETDVFGNPMLNQFAKEVAVVGAALGAGAYAGVNLKHHFFHIPFISGYTQEPTLQFSPGTMAAIRGWHDWKKRDDLDDEFLFTKVMKNWLPNGPIPTIFHKMDRLTDNDIPDIYQDSKFKYFFAIPSTHEK